MTPFDLRSSLAIAANNLIGGGAGQLAVVLHPTAILGKSGHGVGTSGSATFSPVPGAYRMTAGSAGGQSVQIASVPFGDTIGQGFRTGQPWFFESRFALSTAMVAADLAWMGLIDASVVGGVSAGFHGSVSSGFFTLAGGAGSPITTTIPIDTAIHTHRGWRVGATTTYQIDGGALFTGTTDIGAASVPGGFLQNTGDAVARSMDLVYYCGACPFA